MDQRTKEAVESYTVPENLQCEKLYLETFRKNIFPIYSEMGFTFPDAVIAYRLSGTDTSLERIKQLLESLNDDGDDEDFDH